MTNPAQLQITKPDGTFRYLIVEPVIQKTDATITGTGVFKIYKDAYGEESALFTEPLEIGKSENTLPDANNPDYLGTIVFEGELKWHYEGDLLDRGELAQLAEYIKEYR